MANTDTGRAAGTFFGAAPGTRLLNEHEAAYALGLKVATLRRWRWAGKPSAYAASYSWERLLAELIAAVPREIAGSDRLPLFRVTIRPPGSVRRSRKRVSDRVGCHPLTRC